MAEVTTLITEFFSSSYTSKAVANLESSVKKVFSSKNGDSPKKAPVPDRFISMEEVSWHDEPDDCWIIIFDKIYDITEFLNEVSKLRLVTRIILRRTAAIYNI